MLEKITEKSFQLPAHKPSVTYRPSFIFIAKTSADCFHCLVQRCKHYPFHHHFITNMSIANIYCWCEQESWQVGSTVTPTPAKELSGTDSKGAGMAHWKGLKNATLPIQGDRDPCECKCLHQTPEGVLFFIRGLQALQSCQKANSSYRQKNNNSFTYPCFLAWSVIYNVFQYIASPWSQTPAEALHSLLWRRRWSLLIPAFESRACTWEVKWGSGWPSGQKRNSKIQPQTCFCTVGFWGCRGRRVLYIMQQRRW